MGDKLNADAVRDGRAAILPEFLQVGSRVWYWRESLCDEDCCMDMVTAACPLNRGVKWYEDECRRCAMAHPILEETTVWSVQADFSPVRGVQWIVNGLPGVADSRVRLSFFATGEEAMAHRPKAVEYG